MTRQLGWLRDRGVTSGRSHAVEEFERRLQVQFGWTEVVAVASGTTAIRLLLIGLGTSGEVVLPALTFPATAQAVRGAGLTPVVCDIDPDSLGIDVESAATLVNPMTAAILGVHLFGQPCDVAGVERLATALGVHAAFDAAQAVGTRVEGRCVTDFGVASAVSFHWSKVLSCMEGGAVVTTDRVLADRVRGLRNFGLRHNGPPHDRGENGKLSDMNALIGLDSLDHFDQTSARRRQVTTAYEGLLDDIAGVDVVTRRGLGNDAMTTILLHTDLEMTARGLVESMASRRIQCRAYADKRYRSPASVHLPGVNSVEDRLVSLPMYPSLQDAEIVFVVESLRAVLKC